MSSFYFRCSRQFTWRTSLKRHVSKCDGSTNLNPQSSIAESSASKVQSGAPVMFLATEKVGCDNGSVVQLPFQASGELTLREAGTDAVQIRSTQPSVAHPILRSQTFNVHETITVDSANKIMHAPFISTEKSHELPEQCAVPGSLQSSG